MPDGAIFLDSCSVYLALRSLAGWPACVANLRPHPMRRSTAVYSEPSCAAVEPEGSLPLVRSQSLHPCSTTSRNELASTPHAPVGSPRFGSESGRSPTHLGATRRAADSCWLPSARVPSALPSKAALPMSASWLRVQDCEAQRAAAEGLVVHLLDDTEDSVLRHDGQRVIGGQQAHREAAGYYLPCLA